MTSGHQDSPTLPHPPTQATLAAAVCFVLWSSTAGHVVVATPPLLRRPPGAPRLRAVQPLRHHPAGKRRPVRPSPPLHASLLWKIANAVPHGLMQVGVPCGGTLQLLKTVAVQCGSCCGILSVALPPPAPASVELPLQVSHVPCVFFPFFFWCVFSLTRALAKRPTCPSDGTGGRRWSAAEGLRREQRRGQGDGGYRC